MLKNEQKHRHKGKPQDPLCGQCFVFTAITSELLRVPTFFLSSQIDLSC